MLRQIHALKAKAIQKASIIYMIIQFILDELYFVKLFSLFFSFGLENVVTASNRDCGLSWAFKSWIPEFFAVYLLRPTAILPLPQIISQFF